MSNMELEMKIKNDKSGIQQMKETLFSKIEGKTLKNIKKCNILVEIDTYITKGGRCYESE